MFPSVSSHLLFLIFFKNLYLYSLVLQYSKILSFILLLILLSFLFSLFLFFFLTLRLFPLSSLPFLIFQFSHFLFRLLILPFCHLIFTSAHLLLSYHISSTPLSLLSPLFLLFLLAFTSPFMSNLLIFFPLLLSIFLSFSIYIYFFVFHILILFISFLFLFQPLFLVF